MKLNFENLSSKDPKIRYGFTKQLLKTGAENPTLLYEYYDKFEDMLKSGNNILKWSAIDIVGFLSSLDIDNKTVKEIFCKKSRNIKKTGWKNNGFFEKRINTV